MFTLNLSSPNTPVWSWERTHVLWEYTTSNNKCNAPETFFIYLFLHTHKFNQIHNYTVVPYQGKAIDSALLILRSSQLHKASISSEWLIGMFLKFDYVMLFLLSFSLLCQTKDWPKVCTSEAVESTWKLNSQHWFKMSRKQLVTHWYPFTPTHKH